MIELIIKLYSVVYKYLYIHTYIIRIMVMDKRIEIKINKETMDKLKYLSKLPEFDNNRSQVIRSAIHYYNNYKLEDKRKNEAKQTSRKINS